MTARNVPPKVNLSCHNKTEFCYVTCILCDSATFHSEFERKAKKGKGFFITNTLIVCSEHNITYNGNHVNNLLREDYSTREILQLKAELIKQEILNLEDLDSSEEGDSETEPVDETIVSRIDEAVMSFGLLKKENKYLKSLVSEMKRVNTDLVENNKFLRETCQGGIGSSKTDYASMAAGVGSNISGYQNGQGETPSLHTLLVTPAVSFNGDLFDRVKKSILATEKPVSAVIKGRKSVIIKCRQSDSQQLKASLERDLRDSAEVKFPKKTDPLVRIYGVENDLSKEELKEDIARRNGLDIDSFDIEYIYTQQNKKLRDIKVRTSANTYLRVMNQRGIYVGYQKCGFKDDFNFNRCNKCQGFMHSFRNCNRSIKCGICAGDHSSKDCPDSNIKKCINCLKANEFLVKKRDINHAATDVRNCETYKLKWNNIVNSCNYPIRPVLNFGRGSDPSVN